LTEPLFLVTMARMPRFYGPGTPHLGLPLLLGLLATACPSSGTGGADAADGNGDLLEAGSGDARPVPPMVDFTVANCPLLDPALLQCRGAAPLSLSFVPLTSGNVSSFVWDFGDLTRSEEALPAHTYVLPGTYDVGITGTPGPASRLRKAYVMVTANVLGEACDVDRQCEDGLTCVCGAAEQCPSAFARGHCTRSCSGADCPDNALCADLGLNVPPPPPPTMPPSSDGWRSRQCLRRCTMDRDCPAGRRCRLVPIAGAPDRWERACFYSYPAELGAACRGASGIPQNEQCLGGVCADLGALGVCSLDCSSRPCPTDTVCAAFNDGRRLCLRPCTGGLSCRDDPLLGCVSPGAAGPLGFTAAESTAGATYCAPKPCSSDSACAPAGICLGQPGASHCSRRAVP
jgi:PKD repeat protein